MVKFTEVLTYPFRNSKDFLIGGIINIFFWAVIPLFFIFGYLIRIMRNTINNIDMIPDWNEWKDLAKKGIDAIFIVAVYVVIPLIIFIAIVWITKTPIDVELGALPDVSIFVLAIYFLLSIIILILGFLLPMALAHYAATDDVRRAFKFKEIIARIFMRFMEYLISYLFALFLFIIAGSLNAIPYIGFIFSGIFGFYVLMMAARLFSEIYTETLIS